MLSMMAGKITWISTHLMLKHWCSLLVLYYRRQLAITMVFTHWPECGVVLNLQDKIYITKRQSNNVCYNLGCLKIELCKVSLVFNVA